MVGESPLPRHQPKQLRQLRRASPSTYLHSSGKMTTNTLDDSPTGPTTSENQPSGSRLVGGEVSLDVLRPRPLYLENMAVKSQTDKSFVTFSRTQPDFPPVKKINLLDKKRILVTGVSTIDSSLFLFLSFPQVPAFFLYRQRYNLFLKII